MKDTTPIIATILLHHPEAINLLDTNRYVEEHRQKFMAYKSQIPGFTTRHRTGTKAGDIVLFLNGYGVKMFTEVLGFDGDGKAYLLWDCYWFPVDLASRQLAIPLTPLQFAFHTFRKVGQYLHAAFHACCTWRSHLHFHLDKPQS